MHRHTVADSPQVGMEFMYHRRDGLWLFKVVAVCNDGYVDYNYVYYKGGKSKASVTIDDLVEWCTPIDYSRGSLNSPARWKTFITHGSEGAIEMVTRIIIVGQKGSPDWEV